MSTDQREAESDIQYYLRLASQRWKTIAASAAIGLAAGAAYAFLSPPVYQASALIDIEKVGGDVPAPSPAREEGSGDFDDYFETQVRLIVSDTQLRKAYDALGLSRIKEFSHGLPALRNAVSAVPVPHSRLCYLYVESGDARLAASIAGYLADSYVSRNLESQLFMSKKVAQVFSARLTGPKSRAFIEGLPEVVNDRVIQDLSTQLYTDEAALAEMRTYYTGAHPEVLALQSKVDALRARRDEEMNNILTSLKTELSGQFRPNNARVVDEPAVPHRPVRPRKTLGLLIGLAAGIALGGIAALLLGSVRETVLTRQDVERKIGIPFLSLIPLAPRGSERALVPAGVGPISETFRNLVTLVRLSDLQPHDPLLLVTSTTQNEGKSFVAANLAGALSRQGDRVLLVDGDLRNPCQHLTLSPAPQTGLCDYLAGDVTELETIVQKTGVPNLDLVASGASAENPAELLSSGRLTDFVAWTRDRYDRVIIDCSPVFPVSDVLLWGRQVNRAIFVARYGRTRLSLIQTACDRLRATKTEIVGGVINGAKVRTMTYADQPYFERY